MEFPEQLISRQEVSARRAGGGGVERDYVDRGGGGKGSCMGDTMDLVPRGRLVIPQTEVIHSLSGVRSLVWKSPAQGNFFPVSRKAPSQDPEPGLRWFYVYSKH